MQVILKRAAEVRDPVPPDPVFDVGQGIPFELLHGGTVGVFFLDSVADVLVKFKGQSGEQTITLKRDQGQRENESSKILDFLT